MSAGCIAALVIGILLIVAGAAYFAIAYYFRSHFLPNTRINRTDCSFYTLEEAVKILEEQANDWSLTVTGQDGIQEGILHAQDVGRSVDIQKETEKLLANQNSLEWILAYRRQDDYRASYDITFDKEKMHTALDSWDILDPEQMKAPEDAYISDYLETEKAYRIIPEEKGSLLDREKVQKAVSAGIETGADSVNLEEADCYIRAKITSEDTQLNKHLEELNRLVGSRIVIDWNGSEVIVDGDLIHQWIIDDGKSVTLQEEAAAEFVAGQAKAHDTYGKKRKFTTTGGEVLTLPSGAYGWKTDRKKETEALVALIQSGAKENREPIYAAKGYCKGADDIGSSYVEINLTAQHLYLYKDGKIVLESDFVSGNMSKGYVTPAGVFGLTYKTKDAVLRGADYESKVKYWMPFNGNIGMHDASWRRSFGGEIYLTNGSHGCINLPTAKAREIYDVVTTLFPVVCYYLQEGTV